MKKLLLLVTFLFTLLIVGTEIAHCENGLSISGGTHTGHSWSSKTKVDPPEGDFGYGVGLFYEKGIDNGQRIDFTYGFREDIIVFDERNNNTLKIRTRISSISSIEGRIYIRVHETYQVFSGVSGGVAFTGDEFSTAVGFTYGIDKRISESLSIEAGGRHYATARRQDNVYFIGTKYLF